MGSRTWDNREAPENCYDRGFAPTRKKLNMKLTALKGVLALAALLPALALAQAPYFPGKEWAHKPPAESGFDAAKLEAAIDLAVAAESRRPRDMAEDQRASFGKKKPMAISSAR